MSTADDRPRDHGRPAGAPAPDAQPDVPAPSHAERCRTLASLASSATLSTIASDRTDLPGYPYGSLVTVAIDAEGRPLMLLSMMAEHTQNLLARGEASVLVAEALGPGADPLALGRMTLLGPCARVPATDLASAREVFLARNPRASYYVDFKDFGFWRLQPGSIRYIGGFGRMSWVSGDEYRKATPDPLAPAAAGILSHMNEDHADAMVAYAKALAGIAGATAARMTAVDRYGFEMTVDTPEGPRATRLAFEAPLSTTDEVRKAMVAMVKLARQRLA